jgi:hypothetical protein
MPRSARSDSTSRRLRVSPHARPVGSVALHCVGERGLPVGAGLSSAQEDEPPYQLDGHADLRLRLNT